MVNVINNLLDGVEKIETEEVFYLDLIPSNLNKYPMVTEEIRELADSILKYGMFHTIFGMRLNNEDTVTIISGEKRYRALLYLIDELNHHELEMVPCRVYYLKKGMDALEVRIRIMEANVRQRDNSSPDIIQMEVNEAMDIINQLIVQGKKPEGRVRDEVAKMLGRAPRSLQEYINAYNEGKTITDNIATRDEISQLTNQIREQGKKEKKERQLPTDTNKKIKNFIKYISNVDLEEVFSVSDYLAAEELKKNVIELKNVVDQVCNRYYQ